MLAKTLICEVSPNNFGVQFFFVVAFESFPFKEFFQVTRYGVILLIDRVNQRCPPPASGLNFRHFKIPKEIEKDDISISLLFIDKFMLKSIRHKQTSFYCWILMDIV